jgi:hypothetical protein
MFISDERVPVTVGDNTIFIRPKMSVGVKNRVIGAAAKVEGKGAEFNVGAYTTALLVHNVLGWEGPAFEGFKCTPENIEKLDPDESLVEAAIEEIARRNPQGKTDPNSAIAGSNGSKESGKSRRALSISK